MEQVPLRFLHSPPSLEQPHQRTLVPISATVKHSGHFLCRTRPCIIGPGKYHLNNWTADNSLEQWMGGCRGETAVQTPCLTAHYTPPITATTRPAFLPPTYGRAIAQLGPSSRLRGQMSPTSSLSRSLQRQYFHYEPSLPTVYLVPMQHRCMDGMHPQSSFLMHTATYKAIYNPAESSLSICRLIKGTHALPPFTRLVIR